MTIGAISRPADAIVSLLVQRPALECRGNYTDAIDSDDQVPRLLGSNPLGRAPFYYTYCEADPVRGTLFFFRFGLSLRRIRDTVFLTTLINNSAAGQAPHDHYRQSNNENTTVLTHLPANSLFLTFQTCRNLLRETSLLFARDQVSDAWRFILALATLSNKPFSSRLPSSSTTVLSTNSKQHQHSKHRHRASISQISPIRDKAF